MTGLVNYNLTNDEEVAFKELKKRISDEINFLEENVERDCLIYRFLKARKFDVNNAETMLRDHLQFRQKMELDNIMEAYKPEEPLRTHCPVNFTGCDKEGDLIMHLHIGSYDVLGMFKSVKKDDLFQRLMHILELLTRGGMEQTVKLGRLVRWSIVFDLDGLTLAVATNKAVIGLVVETFHIYEAHYPEILKVCFVINAPIYTTYIWNTLKFCFPMETIQKVHIYGRDGFRPELLKLLGPELLAAYLEGTPRTDPDGKPNLFTVKRGKEVPKHFYLKNPENFLSNQVDAEKYNLKSRSRIDITLEVEIPGSYLEWQFESEAHDIGFGLLFKSKENEDLKVMLPITRVSAHLHREIGTFVCEKQGMYVIVLDNSFSWFRGKHIAMKSSVRKPRQEIENEN